MKKYGRQIILIIIIVLLSIKIVCADYVKFSVSVPPMTLTVELDEYQHVKGEGE